MSCSVQGTRYINLAMRRDADGLVGANVPLKRTETVRGRCGHTRARHWYTTLGPPQPPHGPAQGLQLGPAARRTRDPADSAVLHPTMQPTFSTAQVGRHAAQPGRVPVPVSEQGQRPGGSQTRPSAHGMSVRQYAVERQIFGSVACRRCWWCGVQSAQIMRLHRARAAPQQRAELLWYGPLLRPIGDERHRCWMSPACRETSRDVTEMLQRCRAGVARCREMSCRGVADVAEMSRRCRGDVARCREMSPSVTKCR